MKSKIRNIITLGNRTENLDKWRQSLVRIDLDRYLDNLYRSVYINVSQSLWPMGNRRMRNPRAIHSCFPLYPERLIYKRIISECLIPCSLCYIFCKVTTKSKIRNIITLGNRTENRRYGNRKRLPPPPPPRTTAYNTVLRTRKAH